MSQVTSQTAEVMVEQPAAVVLRARISAELEALSAQLSRAAEPGAGNGSRRGRVEMAALQGRVRWLGQLLAGLAEPGDLHLRPDTAGFGSTVVVVDLDTHERSSWTLMSGASMDVGADQVSMESPIGAALIGAKEGDEVLAHVPAGVRRLRVIDVTTLFRKFGVESASPARSSKRTTARSASARAR